MRDLSPFLKLLTTYLSRNTLRTVGPWLSDLVSLTVSSSPDDTDVSSGVSEGSYRPPLPNITTRPLSTFIQVSDTE